MNERRNLDSQPLEDLAVIVTHVKSGNWKSSGHSLYLSEALLYVTFHLPPVSFVPGFFRDWIALRFLPKLQSLMGSHRITFTLGILIFSLNWPKPSVCTLLLILTQTRKNWTCILPPMPSAPTPLFLELCPHLVSKTAGQQARVDREQRFWSLTIPGRNPRSAIG